MIASLENRSNVDNIKYFVPQSSSGAVDLCAVEVLCMTFLNIFSTIKHPPNVAFTHLRFVFFLDMACADFFNQQRVVRKYFTDFLLHLFIDLM